MSTRAREDRARAAGQAVLCVAAALLAIGVLGCVAHDTFRLWGPGHADTDRNVLNCTAYGAAAIVVLLRGALRRGERAGWLVLGCGLAVYSAGWVVFEFGYGGRAPSPSWADALWLSAYLGFYGGVLLLGRARPAARRPRSWLDGGLTGLTLAALVAATALQAVLRSRADGFGIVVAAAYPSADIALLTGLGATFAARDWRLSVSGRLLGTGALLFVSADTVYTIASINGSYHAGVAYDPSWTVAIALIAAAAWASGEPPAAASQGAGARGLVVPCLAALASLGLLVFAAATGGLNPVAYGLAAAALALALARLVLTLRDAAALAESRRLSLTDDLTGLPNRRALTASLEAALEQGAPAALVMIDLDGFKELNDTLGHPVGDELLQGVAVRLADCVRGGDVVARLGGDEFAVLLHGAGERAAVAVARRMREALGRPLPLAGMSLYIGASLGIALAPDHASDGVALMRHADVAMYDAKHARTGIAVSAPGGTDSSRERLALAGELRGALRRNELELLYQPLASIADGRVRGAEALIRWRHPARGLLTPDVFLPALELTELMRDVTRFVLESAIRQGAVWAAAGTVGGVAVNLSATDLLDLELPARVGALLDGHGLDPARLTIEITESAFITDPQRATEVLEALRARGVRIALDDFGTGYSSLTHLQRLPADLVKIDRSFVAAMLCDERAAAIVASTIDLAHALGLTVVAEGVEQAALWRRLAAAGCDAAQGWLLSRALDAESLERQLAAIEGRARGAAAGSPLVS